MAYLQTSSGKIFYTYDFKHIEADTIIMGHGVGFDHTIWDSFKSHLKEYNILTFDFRGHGYSDRMEGPYSWDIFLYDFDMLLEHLKIGEFHYIGNGNGYYFIIEYILCRQDHTVKSIISISTPGYYPKKIGKKGIDARKELAEKHGFNHMLDLIIPQFVNKDYILLIKGCFSRLDRKVYFPLLDLAVELQSKQKLNNINLPVLYLSGELDQNYPPQLNSLSSSYIKESKFFVIPDASNLVHLDQPELTAKFIKTFLKESSKKSHEQEFKLEFWGELQNSLKFAAFEGLNKVEEQSSLTIHFLNGFKITYKGQELIGKWNQRKAKNIMIFLALNKTVTREQLCDLFWSDRPVSNGLKNVRVALTHLRGLFKHNNLTIDDFIAIDSERLSLNEQVVSDVEQLITKLNEIEQQDERLKVEELQKIIRELKFPLFNGIYDDWLISLRESLENRIYQNLLFLKEHSQEEGLIKEYNQMINKLGFEL